MATSSSSHDRFDHLAPRDVAITLRSLGRRLGAVQSRACVPRLADVLERPGPTGVAIDALLGDAARGGSLTASALTTSLIAADPVIAAAVLDPSERVFVDDRSWSIGAAIDLIISDAEQAAERVEHASADELGRAVAITGGGSTTPLAVAQQLVRELIGALTASEHHVEWLEGQV